MSNGVFKAYNGQMPTAAAVVPVATGTVIKTMLQLATPSTIQATVLAWGISFDGTATTTPVRCELVETDVAATVTAYSAASALTKITDPGGPASALTLGTAASGFTATAEGTITATRVFDYQQIQPTNQYVWEFPLGREPVVAVSKFLRVRVTAATTVNAVCWVEWEE